jgi:hypothetical protein
MAELIAFAYSVLMLTALVCLVTAALDMMMNGARGADWAPYGFGASLVCFIVAGLLVP